jgi:CubicO group peptidase (beta-lactamase class C family)
LRPTPALPAALPTSVIPTATPDPDVTFAHLCDQVQLAMRQYRVPGVAIGVVFSGQQHAAGFGVTNIEHPTPVDTQTLFLAGSISKTYTATALMLLKEDGLLDFHVPIRTYLPDLMLADEATAANVTMTHLVTHSSGWYGDFFVDTGSGDDALAKYVGRLAELPQVAPLGYLFNYSNAGMALAGRVIEVVTKEPFEKAMASFVIGSLAARNTYYYLDDVITRGFAVGHTIRSGQQQVVRPYALPRALHPAAGVITTIEDVLDFARFHLDDGNTPSGLRLMSAAALTVMHSRIGPSLPDQDGIAVNWFLDHIGDTSFIYHNGSMPGQRSLLFLCPARQFALAILTNADTGDALTGSVLRSASLTYLGRASPTEKTMERTADELTSYVGRYSVPGHLVYDVKIDGSSLAISQMVEGFPGGVFNARFTTGDVAEILTGTRQGRLLDFPRTVSGDIGWIRIDGRLAKREP